MKKKLLKIILIFTTYSVPSLIFLNLLLFLNQKNKSDLLYKNLNNIGYTKSKVDPYKAFTIQYINPHYIFGLPILEEKRKNISNKYVTIDQNGYRTTYPLYYSDEKDSLKKCILILGGSTTFGHGVSSDRNTFSSFIQSKLGEDYKVFNLGTPSWNSRQELVSVINFISRPISKKCNSIDTISISGSNDIYVTQEYLNTEFIKNEFDAIEFISAPESFSHLMAKVDNIRSSNNKPIKLTKDLIQSLFKICFGNLFTAIEGKLNLYTKNYLKENHNIFSKNDKKFIDNQVNAFWKNHILIANIIEEQSNFGHKNSGRRNKHLVIIQPNLKFLETNSIWSFANQRINNSLKSQTLPSNIKILDLRGFSLTDEKQQISLSEILKISQSELKKKDLLNLNYFDNVHLTDIGVKRFGKYILNEYHLITSQN